MATARGANTKLLAKVEGTYGTNPAGTDWRQFAFIPPLDLGGAQQLLESPIIGLSTGRDLGDPFYDAVDVDGTLNVPLDLSDIGFWLKLLLGAPTTTEPVTDSGDFQHIYKSGSATALPSAAIEVGLPDMPNYLLLLGAKLNTMQLQTAPTGRPEVRFGVMAKSATRSGTSVDSSPTLATGWQQFNNFQATISREGSALGYVTSAQMDFSNNVEAIRDIGSGTGIKEALEGDSTANINLSVRLADTTLLDDSEGTDPVALQIKYQIGATKLIQIDLGRVFLPRRKAVIQGRAGVQVDYEARAAYDETNACTMMVTLKNQTESY